MAGASRAVTNRERDAGMSLKSWLEARQGLHPQIPRNYARASLFGRFLRFGLAVAAKQSFAVTDSLSNGPTRVHGIALVRGPLLPPA